MIKALSIRQPWSWLIVNRHKPLENRTWRTQRRGVILIHAGKQFDKAGYAWVRETFPEIIMPEPHEFERGGIVGQASITGVITHSDSPWFFGPVAFELADASPLPFYSLAGNLGFFDAL